MTRAVNQYHGTAYAYLKNEALNANNFSDNWNGLKRRPQKEYQVGYQAGGPVVPKGEWRNRLFFSSAFDQLVSHSALDPQTYAVPTTNFIVALALPADRLARQLLEKYHPPAVQSNLLIDNYTAAQPVVVDRSVALERGDYTTKSGRDRLLARLAINRLSQPDFIWSPYADFTSGLSRTPLRSPGTGCAPGPRGSPAN